MLDGIYVFYRIDRGKEFTHPAVKNRRREGFYERQRHSSDKHARQRNIPIFRVAATVTVTSSYGLI